MVTNKVTEAYLQKPASEFIPKNNRPPQSPDCTQMDYAIWDSHEENVYWYWVQRDKLTDQELKDTNVASWELIPLDEIRNSISGWKKRLQLVV